MYSVADETRKPIFEGVQGENEARSIEFDITPWVEELGNGACTATAKRPTDTTPYPVTVTRSGNVVTWKPDSTDTAIEGLGAFQLSFSIDDVVAKTRIWNTKIAPSLVGAGDPPDPYDDWLQDLRDIAADALQDAQDADASAQDAEAWAKGTKNGVDVPSTDPTYENNAKYYAEQSLANQYGAYIVKSASGDIASFSDGADDVPMKSLNVTITPKQSGSGDPSPDNVRPITGFDTVNIKKCASLLKPSAVRTETINGITFQSFGDGSYRISGTSTAIAYCPILPIEQFAWPSDSAYSIYLNNSVGTGDASVYFFDGTTQIDYWTCAVENRRIVLPQPTLNGRNCNGIRLYVKAGVTIDMKLAPMVSKAPTTAPVPLGQTVYGGTVDVGTGVLTITHGRVNLGSFNYSYSAPYFYSAIANKKAGLYNIMADIYLTATQPSASAMGNNEIKGGANNTSIFIRDDRYTSGADLKNALNGIYAVYELDTPTTVQLTPAQVATLLGTNNVWSDAGAVEVEYRADPTLAYNELANVIVSLGGNL